MRMDNKGMTLVEVTCGFLLLVVSLASFMKIVNLSSELSSAAVNTRKNNDTFEERYFEGSNYEAEGDKDAFRTNMDVTDTETHAPLAITLSEWHPDGKGYFEEWYRNDDGDMVVNTNPGTSLVTYSYQLNNVSLKRIENIYDKEAAKTCVFRFVYKEEENTAPSEGD